MEELAGACAEVIKQLSFKRLHIIGHSMGGAVGLLLPAQVLQSITSFSSIEGNLTGEDCGSASRRAASVSYEEFCSRILPEYKKNFAAYASLDSASPDAYYRSAHSLVTWSDSGEPLKRYRSLPCKKTYFYGDENKLHPTVQITSFAPQCEISASGSFPMVDNPGQFYPALIELMLQ
jgi:pimeloyl-ACP methyl ester carboxylesterase